MTKLKEKNRKRLEHWWAEKTMEEVGGIYKDRDLYDIGMYGVTGAAQLSDKDLVFEWTNWCDVMRELNGMYPILKMAEV